MSITCRAGAMALALVFASSLQAAAQEEPIPEADPIGDEPTPPPGPADEGAPPPGDPGAGDPGAPGESPLGEANRRNPGPGFGVGRSHARLRWEQYRIPFEIDEFRETLGVGIGSRGMNRRTDWLLEKTSMRLEAGYGVGGDGIELDIYGGLGWGWTEIGLDAAAGSDLTPGGPSFSTDVDSDIDFDLSLGVDLWAMVTDTIFVGAGYEFIYSHASFDDEVFIAVPADLRADLTIHDVSVRVGARINRMISVWGGAGFTAVWGEVDLDPKGGGGDLDFELDNESVVKGLVGFSLHPGDNVVTRFEAQFMPEPTFRVDVGWSF